MNPLMLLYLAICFGVIYVVASIMMVHQLEKWNIKINYLFLRVLILKYANQYRKLSTEKQGRPGGLFCLWIISINCALVCAGMALLIRYNIF